MKQATVEELKQVIDAVKHPLRKLGKIKPNNDSVIDKQHVTLIEGMMNVGVPLDKVEIKASPVHGHGVFTKQKIQKGELITLYPAHYITLHPKGKGTPGRYGLIGGCYGEKKGLTLTDTVRLCYGYDVTEQYSIYGHPQLVHDPAFLGHMINDGARGHSSKTTYNQKDEFLYCAISRRLVNAIFYNIGGLCVAIIATKDINIGEEVLLTYGYPYWTSMNSL